MGRPPLEIGTWGTIRTHEQTRTNRAGKQVAAWRAITQYRGTDGRTRPVERTGRTENLAKKALLDHLKAITREQQASKAKVKPTTRYEVVAEVYLRVAAGSIAATSMDRYRSHLRKHLVPRLGGLQVRELTVPALQDLMATLAREGKTYYADNKGARIERRGPLAANTLRQIRAVLKDSIQVAVDHGALPDNPVKHLRRIKGEGKQARTLMGEERANILETLDGDPVAARADLPHLVRFLGGSGTRIGEALGLPWRYVNLTDKPVLMHDEVGEQLVPPGAAWINGNLVHVVGRGLVRNQGKTFRARRVIVLPPWLAAMLALRFERDAPAMDDPVFPSARGSWRWPHNTRRSLRLFLDRNELARIHPHVLRKMVATVLDEMGLTARQIADVLGHAQVSMTQDVYMGRGATDPAAAAALGRALGMWAAPAAPDEAS